MSMQLLYTLYEPLTSLNHVSALRFLMTFSCICRTTVVIELYAKIEAFSTCLPSNKAMWCQSPLSISLDNRILFKEYSLSM